MTGNGHAAERTLKADLSIILRVSRHVVEVLGKLASACPGRITRYSDNAVRRPRGARLRRIPPVKRRSVRMGS